MKRALFAIIASVYGLISLLGYTPGSGATLASSSDVKDPPKPASATGKLADSSDSASSPEAGIVNGATSPAKSTGSAKSSATTSAAPQSGGSAAGGGQISGAVVEFDYGEMQVAVTVDGGEVVDVEAVKFPTDGFSKRINEGALPDLRTAALAAQSADFDSVSGATATSEAYKESLQAALDQV